MTLPTTPAQAARIDGGTLSPGTRVTVNFTDDDRVYAATVAVPAGRRLTLLADDAPADLDQARSVSLNVTSPIGDACAIGYTKTFGNETGVLRFVVSDVASVDRLLTVDMSANRLGAFAFTPGLVTDVPPVAVRYRAPTPVSIAVPGQHAKLTVPVVLGHKLRIRVTAVRLSDPKETNFVWPNGYQLTVLLADGSEPFIDHVGEGVYEVTAPSNGGTSKPLTIDVGGVGVATGSLTVEALAIRDTPGTA